MDRPPEPGTPPTPPMLQTAQTSRRPRAPQRPAEAWITIPWDTLTGIANDPGSLKGFGPISADQARTMALDLLQNGSWRCAAVDDHHNTLLGLGRRTYTTRYRPGTHLRRYTSALYGQQCAFPTCTTHAHHCDYDHLHPHAKGGVTCACNGIPLCRRCHRLKTTGLIDVQPSTDPTHPHGTLIWTTTTGQRHLHRPTPLTPQNPTNSSTPSPNPNPPSDPDPGSPPQYDHVPRQHTRRESTRAGTDPPRLLADPGQSGCVVLAS